MSGFSDVGELYWYVPRRLVTGHTKIDGGYGCSDAGRYRLAGPRGFEIKHYIDCGVFRYDIVQGFVKITVAYHLNCHQDSVHTVSCIDMRCINALLGLEASRSCTDNDQHRRINCSCA